MSDRGPHVGVGCIVTRGGRVLLVKRRGRHGGGQWSTPGGHLDLGESPEVCAARETLEETGVGVTPPRFVGITSDVFDATGPHYITLWMHARHRAGEAVIAAPDELEEVGWFRRDEFPSPRFLSLENLLANRCYVSSADLPEVLAGIRDRPG